MLSTFQLKLANQKCDLLCEKIMCHVHYYRWQSSYDYISPPLLKKHLCVYPQRRENQPRYYVTMYFNWECCYVKLIYLVAFDSHVRQCIYMLLCNFLLRSCTYFECCVTLTFMGLFSWLLTWFIFGEIC